MIINVASNPHFLLLTTLKYFMLVICIVTQNLPYFSQHIKEMEVEFGKQYCVVLFNYSHLVKTFDFLEKQVAVVRYIQ